MRTAPEPAGAGWAPQAPDKCGPIPVMRPWLGEEEVAAASEVIRSGWVAQGPQVAEFERAFAARTGAPAAVALSSGTAALHLALVLLGVGSGDDVVVPSLSFIATTNAVRHAGACPRFADVDAATLNVTPETVAVALTPATRAVIVVHQAGVPADIAAIHAMCEPLGIAVVEDAACALGATYRNRPIGAHSELVAFSFHPRKIITTGEGGMLTLSSEANGARARRLREHGMTVSATDRHGAGSVVFEEYDECGWNYRMTDIQAAIGLVQLTRLDAIVAERRRLARVYQEGLSSIAGMRTVQDPYFGRTNYQSFWVVLPADCPVSQRDALDGLLARGVSARRGIMAAHLERPYRDALSPELPVTEDLTTRSLILPLHHGMQVADQEAVVDALKDVLVSRTHRR